MIRLAKQDWDKFLRDNNPEVFTEEQINAWIESNRDLLVKAEGKTLSAQDNQFVQDFRTEISHFTKVEVLRPNDDKLQKSLVHEIFYIREQQVDWDEEIIKSEDGEEFSFGTYRETSLNNKLGRTGNLIEKGKRGQLGEIREWKGGKYKKTAQGWVPVSEGKENKDSGFDKNVSKLHEKYMDLSHKVYDGKPSEKEKKLLKELDAVLGEHGDDYKLFQSMKKMSPKIIDKLLHIVSDYKESKEESSKDSKSKGEEKAKLLKEVFEFMDFLDIDRKEFSELKEKHGGLKGLHEFLSNELSGEHNKIDIKIGDELVDDDGNEVTVTSLNKESVWVKYEKGNEKRYPWKIVSQKFEKINDKSKESGKRAVEEDTKGKIGKVITAKELKKKFSNVEDWGDLGDRVSVDGDKLEVVNPYFYGGEKSLSSLKDDWTGSDGWMSKYLKKEYGIKLTVESEDLQVIASGKYKKFGKNMGVAILKLKIEKA